MSRLDFDVLNFGTAIESTPYKGTSNLRLAGT
jgi:hypothetical protein